MKRTLVIVTILLTLAVGVHASNYTITINGKTVDIVLDKEMKIETAGGGVSHHRAQGERFLRVRQ